MAALNYTVVVYSETLSNLVFEEVTKYLTAQFDPLIDPSIIDPGEAVRFLSS